jgi:membrane protein
MDSFAGDDMDKAVRNFEFMKALWEKMNREYAYAHACQLAYSLLMALFPFIIFLFTLIGFRNMDSAAILSALDKSLPESVYGLISDFIIDVVDKERGGIMSLSVLVALIASSGGFRDFMDVANKSMGVQDRRNMMVKLAISIFWVRGLSAAILLALVGIVFGRQIVALLTSLFPLIPYDRVLAVLGTTVPVIFILFVVTGCYMMVPAKKVKLRYALPGSIFTTSSWIMASLLFKSYIDNFSGYSRFYGALGAVVALMIWLLLSSLLLIAGVSMNALMIEMRGVKDPYIEGIRGRIEKRKRTGGSR